MTIGIYKLNFSGTNKVYIGQSINIEQRYKQHITSLRAGTSNYKMLEAYKLYKEPVLEILCECTQQELNNTEKEAIEIFDAVDSGLNILKDQFGNGFGEDSANSKHSNLQVIQVFNILVDSPTKTANEIHIDTGVSMCCIEGISSLNSHLWLEEMFPEKYALLRNLKGTRAKPGEGKTSSKNTSNKIIEVFELLISIPKKTAKEINSITGVSVHVINSISKLQNHTWLKGKFPEKYAILETLKGTRNAAESRGIQYPKVLSPEGDIFNITNATKFAKEHNLDQAALSRVLHGQAKTHKGWKLA